MAPIQYQPRPHLRWCTQITLCQINKRHFSLFLNRIFLLLLFSSCLLDSLHPSPLFHLQHRVSWACKLQAIKTTNSYISKRIWRVRVQRHVCSVVAMILSHLRFNVLSLGVNVLDDLRFEVIDFRRVWVSHKKTEQLAIVLKNHVCRR